MPTIGNILRADGTTFKSISEDLFQRSNKVLDKIHPSRLDSWDDFITNEGELNNRISPSGHNWVVKNMLTNANVSGEFSVSQWRASKTSNTFDIAALIPISATNGLFTEIKMGSRVGFTPTTTFLIYYLNGDYIVFAFNYIFSIYKIISGVRTTILSENVSNFLPNYGELKQGVKIKVEASTTFDTVSNKPQISLRANSFNKAYTSNDLDFIRIMRDATHVGIAGYRSAIIEGIKNTLI